MLRLFVVHLYSRSFYVHTNERLFLYFSCSFTFILILLRLFYFIILPCFHRNHIYWFVRLYCIISTYCCTTFRHAISRVVKTLFLYRFIVLLAVSPPGRNVKRELTVRRPVLLKCVAAGDGAAACGDAGGAAGRVSCRQRARQQRSPRGVGPAPRGDAARRRRRLRPGPELRGAERRRAGGAAAAQQQPAVDGRWTATRWIGRTFDSAPLCVLQIPLPVFFFPGWYFILQSKMLKLRNVK